jgi:DNA-binding SARP family transcriptional activator/tetratricopeptide (TPR) repeat protein
VWFRVLGPVEVHTDDAQVLTLPRRQERCLLAILLLETGKVMPITRLCDLLWDGDPPPRADRTVRTYVARIRALLTRANAADHGVALVSDRGGYLLKAAPDMVDAHQFRHLLDRAATITDLTGREAVLKDALALWRGPALHHAASDQLRDRLCADLIELHLHAEEEALATSIELGHDRAALPQLARANAESPGRERIVELLMLALYRDSRTREALDLYTRTREHLAENLGIDPGPALQRLHTAILRGDPVPGRTTPPPTPQQSRPAQLPRDLPNFVGRLAQLDQLNALLPAPPAGPGSSGSAVVISAIAGTAGVGKTALAVHWAHEIRHRFPDGQLYINLRGFDPAATPTVPAEAIRRFLDAFGVEAQLIPSDFDSQVGLYRSLLVDRRVLVILDNARDADQVRPLLPGAPGCLVVITSRNQLTSLVAVEDARHVPLDVLTQDEARQLLATRLGQQRVAAEPAAMDEIVASCARLPLALAIVAARAATYPKMSLAALAYELRTSEDRLSSLDAGDATADVRTVISWSYRALRPEAARLFRLLGLTTGPDISIAAAASLAGLPRDQVEPILAELIRAHLLSEPVPGRLTFHDLLHAYARQQANDYDSDEARRSATNRLIAHYGLVGHRAAILLDPHRQTSAPVPPTPEVPPEKLADRQEALAWFATEHKVLAAVVHQAAKIGAVAEAAQLAWALTGFLDRRGEWQDLAGVQSAALDAARRASDKPAEARARSGLAIAHVRLRRYDEALAHFERALELSQESGDLETQAHLHHNIGWLHSLAGRLPQAITDNLRALDLYRTLGNRQGQARAFNAIGWHHSLRGDGHETLAFCHKALVLFEELDDRQGQAQTLDSLGSGYRQIGEHEQAIACYERALTIYRGAGDGYYEAKTLAQLGDIRAARGEEVAAAESWRNALALFERFDDAEAEELRAKLGLVS